MQALDYDGGEITIEYEDEPEEVYELAVLPHLVKGKLRLKQRCLSSV